MNIFVSINFKLIAIDLSKQSSELESQQINFVGKLEQDATIFFIIEELLTTRINFKQKSYDIPIKNKKQTYKAITELIGHDLYTTGNSLTYEYFCKYKF